MGVHSRWMGLLCACCLLVFAGCSGDDSTNGAGGDPPGNGGNNGSAPAASFTVNPAVVIAGGTVTVDASASTGSTLQFRWDWENDGFWDTGYGVEKNAAHQYPVIGSYTVKLEVKDAASRTASATRSVVVNPSTPGTGVPTASFTIDHPGAVPNAPLHVDASGCTDTVDDAASLQVRWDWEDDGTYDTAYSTVKTADHAYAQKGSYTIRLQVRNTQGVPATAVKTVTIDDNLPPVAGFTVGSTTVAAGEYFTVNAGGSTDDHDAASTLQVRWDWENDGTWDTEYSTVKTLQYRYPAESSMGARTIRLEVMDAWGATTTMARTITLLPSTNLPPSAFFLVNPIMGTTATNFTVDASGCSDAEDSTANLQVRWDWENDGTWDTGYSSVKTAKHRYTTTGLKTIRLQVMDRGGRTGTASSLVSVTRL